MIDSVLSLIDIFHQWHTQLSFGEKVGLWGSFASIFSLMLYFLDKLIRKSKPHKSPERIINIDTDFFEITRIENVCFDGNYPEKNNYIASKSNQERIYKKLISNKMFIVVGYPGSGKTCLAASACFYNKKRNQKIYYSNIERSLAWQKKNYHDIFNEIQEISNKNENSIFLLDNINSSFNKVNSLINKSIINQIKCYFLVTMSADIPKYYVMLDNTLLVSSMQNRNLTMETNPNSIFKERIKSKYKNATSKQIDEIIKICNGNLYNLNIYLRIVDNINNPQKEQALYSYSENKVDAMYSKYGIHGVFIIYYISVWNSYGVDIEKDFFIENGEGESLKEALGKLISSNEVIDHHGMIHIPNKAASILYKKAINNKNGIYLEMKKKYPFIAYNSILENAVIYSYLKYMPHSINLISRQICNNKEILEIISRSEESISHIFEMLVREKDLSSITETFINFEWQNHIISKNLISKVIDNKDYFLEKIHRETSLINIFHFLSPMWFLSQDLDKKDGKIISYTKKEPNMVNIETMECAHMVKKPKSINFAKKISDSHAQSFIEKGVLKENISYSKFMKNFTLCVKDPYYSYPIYCAKMTFSDARPAKAILLEIDKQKIISLINKENKLKNISYAIDYLIFFDEVYACSIINQLSMEHVAMIFNKEKENDIKNSFIFALKKYKCFDFEKFSLDLEY